MLLGASRKQVVADRSFDPYSLYSGACRITSESRKIALVYDRSIRTDARNRSRIVTSSQSNSVASLIPSKRIELTVLLIRGVKMMLDSDLWRFME
jgi:hypothetical protein